jgi:hypothetical protein
MSSSRSVDQIQAIEPRPVEMQVLCLGLSRTSTMSMYTLQAAFIAENLF